MTDPEEGAAQRIAARGRDALLERLRPAFAKAAESQPGAAPLEPERLEALVQAAADRADGVLWRRALAGVGKDELGIGLGEAIDHPAVQRAHEMLGVPAYQPAALARTGRAAQAAQPARPAPGQAASSRRPPAQGRAAPSRRPVPPGSKRRQTGPSTAPQPRSSAAPETIRMAAVHLSGIETVREGTRDLELRFSDIGLDVVSTVDGETIGRLTWEDITALELPQPRRSRWTRGRRAPELLVQTDRGQANFELPGLTEDQVREHLASVSSRVRGTPSSG